MKFLIFALLTGCTEYAVIAHDTKVDECPDPIEIVDTDVPPPTYPDIEVLPIRGTDISLDVATNETHEEKFIILNVGNSDLDVTDISLELNDGLYTLQDANPEIVPPVSSIDFLVTFEPDSAGTKEEYLLISSNDPDESLVRIPLSGIGLAPQIEVVPLIHNFGQPYLRCYDEVEIIIRNIGTTDLEINNLTYSSTPDLDFIFDYSFYGDAPWILAPNEEILAIASYDAYDEIYDIAYLTVDSNDPLEPTVIALQEGDAIRGGTTTDTFIQEETEKVDILFVIDNSCSMSNEQMELATNSTGFVTTLDASGADYRLATITTDSPIFRGPVLSPGYFNLIDEFKNQLTAGTLGNSFELGLQMAYEATSPTGLAAVGGIFQRLDAILSIVFVSDEDDFSIGTVSFYVNHFQNLKSSPDKVMLHAVSVDPDNPVYCGAHALRYKEGVDLTGGLFASICTPDWATDLQDLANGSLVPNLDFPLSEVPITDTIEVLVNGVAATVGWSYNPAPNEIVFTEQDAPVGGDIVEITYGYYVECP